MALVVDAPARVRSDLPTKTRRVGEVAVKSAEVGELWLLEDRAACFGGALEHVNDLLLGSDDLSQGHTGSERGPRWRRGTLACDVALKRIGAEQREQPSVTDLKEDDLAEILLRLPTQAVTVEPPSHRQIGNAQGDDVEVLAHRASL